jgi:hypothetical protein
LLSSFWNWPSLHVVQMAALAAPEKLPAAHGVQLRSEVELPTASMRIPAEHEV